MDFSSWSVPGDMTVLGDRKCWRCAKAPAFRSPCARFRHHWWSRLAVVKSSLRWFAWFLFPSGRRKPWNALPPPHKSPEGQASHGSRRSWGWHRRFFRMFYILSWQAGPGQHTLRMLNAVSIPWTVLKTLYNWVHFSLQLCEGFYKTRHRNWNTVSIACPRTHSHTGLALGPWGKLLYNLVKKKKWDNIHTAPSTVSGSWKLICPWELV